MEHMNPTCVVDMQLIHDPLVPPAEHHHQLLNGYGPVSVPGPWDWTSRSYDALPAGL